MKKRKLLSALTAFLMTSSLTLPVFAAELVGTELGANVTNDIVSGKLGETVPFTIRLSENGNLKESTNITVATYYILDSTGLRATNTTKTITFAPNRDNYNSVEIAAEVEISNSAKLSIIPYYLRLDYIISNSNSGLKDTQEDNLKVSIIGDITAPIVTATPDRAANENGWYNNDVTVSFSATDPESTITSVDRPKTISTEGENQVVSGSATNSAGLTGTGSTTISIDKTAPTIDGSADRAANDAGWYNSDVTVSFAANDALSGVASSTTPVTLGEGKDQSVIGTAIDRAGNDASTTVSGINIDKTAPTISGNANSESNAAGWYNEDVTVTFDANDALSGIANVTEPVVLGEGKDQSVIGTAIDRAGNDASTTVSGINIDKTAPTISGSVNSEANAAGWYNKDVTVTFDANDALSGVESSTAPIILGEGANQSAEGTATDKAGNTTSTKVEGINIDKTNPTINVKNGATYILNQNVTWTATDALSGLATASSGTLDTSKVGTYTQTIKATDIAGNTEEVKITYTVNYAFGGILQPINVNGSSIFKAGSTVPVKFQLKNYEGTFVSTAIASLSYAKVTDSILGTDVEAISTSAATVGNTFRYDSTANQYIFNFNTKGLAAGTYQLTIKLDDNTTQVVRISLK